MALPSGATHDWQFDNATTLADTIGTVDVPVTGATVVSFGLDFDGTDYAALAQNEVLPELTQSADWTVCFLFKARLSGTSLAYYFQHRLNSDKTNVGLQDRKQGTLTAIVKDDSAATTLEVAFSTPAVYDEARLITMRWEAATQTLTVSANDDFAPSTTVDYFSSGGNGLGFGATKSGSYNYNGILARSVSWDRRLTDTEVHDELFNEMGAFADSRGEALPGWNPSVTGSANTSLPTPTVTSTAEVINPNYGSANVNLPTLTASASGEVVNPQVITSQIQSGEDDAEEFREASSGNALLYPQGYTYATSSDLELAYDPNNAHQYLGVRFPNLSIPAGSEIASAKIIFTADGAPGTTGAVTLTIDGEDSSSPQAYTQDADGSGSFGISSRARTTASASWSITETWSAGAEYETPDLAAIVQEIIDRDDWASGGGLAFILYGDGVDTDYRRAKTYETDPALAPKIEVIYRLPPSTTITTQVAASGDDVVALEDGAGGALSTTATSNFAGHFDSANYNYRSFMRFQLNVAHGSKVLASKLRFMASSLVGSIPTTQIRAENVDSAGQITTKAGFDAAEGTSRGNLTTADVAWTPNEWSVDSTYDSANIAAVIQEIVDRPGWVSGNYINIWWGHADPTWPGVQQRITAYSFDGAGDTPLLEVTYIPPIEGSTNTALPSPTVTASGELTITGAASADLPALTVDATGTERFYASVDTSLPSPTVSATGAVDVPHYYGSANASLPSPTASASGTVRVYGSTDASLPSPTVSATGTVDVPHFYGSANTDLPAPTASATGTMRVYGSTDANLPSLTASASGTVDVPHYYGSADASLDIPTVTGTATVRFYAEGSPSLPTPTSSATATVDIPHRYGSVDTNLPTPTVAATGTMRVYGSTETSLPSPTVAATGELTISARTESDNLAPPFSQWTLSGGAYVDADGVLYLTAYGDKAESPLMRTGGKDWWRFSAQCFDDEAAPVNTHNPDGDKAGRLYGTSYYDAAGDPVENDGGWTGNGNANDYPVGEWSTRADGSWGMGGHTAVEYVRFRISTHSSWTSPSYEVRKPMLTVGDTSAEAPYEPYVPPGASLPSLTSSASGTVDVPHFYGSADTGLPAPTVAAAGTMRVYGSLSSNLPQPTVSATGAVDIPHRYGSADAELPTPTLSAQGQLTISGAVTAALDAPVVTATSTVRVYAEGSPSLPAPTSSATATVDVPHYFGSANADLSTPTAAATGTMRVYGETSASLPTPTVSASGTVRVYAQADAELPTPTSDASAAVDVPHFYGAADVNLPTPSLDSSGTLRVYAEADIPLPTPVVSATGAVDIPHRYGSADAQLPTPSLDANATMRVYGDLLSQLPAITVAGTGTERFYADADTSLPSPTVEAAGELTISGAANANLPSLSLDASATMRVYGTISAGLPLPTVSATGTERFYAAADLTLSTPTVSATGELTISGAADTLLPTLDVASSGKLTISGAVEAGLPTPASAATATMRVYGEVDTGLPSPTVAATGTERFYASSDADLPALTVSATADSDVPHFYGSADTSLPEPTVAATGTERFYANSDVNLPTPTVSATAISDIPHYFGSTDTGVQPLHVKATANGVAPSFLGDVYTNLPSPTVGSSGSVDIPHRFGSTDTKVADLTLDSQSSVIIRGDVAVTSPSLRLRVTGKAWVGGAVGANLSSPTMSATGATEQPHFQGSTDATLPTPRVIGGRGRLTISGQTNSSLPTLQIAASAFVGSKAESDAWIPKPTLAATGASDIPHFEGTVGGSITLSVSAGAAVEPPLFSGAANVTLPLPTGSVVAEVAPPQFEGRAEVTLALSSSATGTVDIPRVSGVTNATLPALSVVAHYVPAPTGFITYTLPYRDLDAELQGRRSSLSVGERVLTGKLADRDFDWGFPLRSHEEKLSTRSFTRSLTGEAKIEEGIT